MVSPTPLCTIDSWVGVPPKESETELECGSPLILRWRLGPNWTELSSSPVSLTHGPYWRALCTAPALRHTMICPRVSHSSVCKFTGNFLSLRHSNTQRVLIDALCVVFCLSWTISPSTCLCWTRHPSYIESNVWCCQRAWKRNELWVLRSVNTRANPVIDLSRRSHDTVTTPSSKSLSNFPSCRTPQCLGIR